MSSVNDCKLFQLESLFGQGHIDDLFLDWLKLSGDVSKNLSSAQHDFLDRHNVPTGHINDRWFNWLGDQGVTGKNLSDRWRSYWCGASSTIPDGSFMCYLPLLIDRYDRSPLKQHATLSRNSPSSVTDFEDNVIETLPHEFGFEGARRVEELATFNSDLRDTDEVGEARPWTDSIAGTATIDSVTFDGQQSRVVLNLNGGTATGDIAIRRNAVAVKTGDKFYHSCWMKLAVGTSAVVQLILPTGGSQNITITDQWARYAVFSNGAFDGTVNFGVRLRGGQGTADKVDFYIKEFSITKTSEVSEFVSPNDSACSDHDIPVRYFDTTNGNSVDANGVVHEAAGVYLGIEGVDAGGTMKRLAVWEESENLINYSHDLSQWAYLNGGSYIGLGPDNSHEITVDNSSASGYACDANLPLTTDTYTIKVRVRAKNTIATFRLRLGQSSTLSPDITVGEEWTDVEFTEASTGLASHNGFHQNTGQTGFNLYVKYAQTELKSYPTPLIFTNGAAATRLADDVQVAWPAGVVNDFILSCDLYAWDWPSNKDLLNLVGGLGDSIRIYTGSVSRVFCAKNTAASGLETATLTGAPTSGRIETKVRYSRTTGISAWLDGAGKADNPAATGDLVNPKEFLSIGSGTSTNDYINSNIGNITVQTGDLTDDEIIIDPDIALDTSTLTLNDGDAVKTLGFLTSTDSPTYNANNQNGLGTIKFDGVGNVMTGAFTPEMRNFSFYAVMTYGTHLNNGGLITCADTGGNDWDAINGFGFLVHSGSGDQGKAIMIREAGGDGLSLTSAFPDPNQFALFEMTVNYDTGVATAYVNGVQTVTDTVSDEGLIKPQLFALGARILTGSYSLFTDCEFAEFRLYNREVSVNRQASIRQELMVKWGL